MVDFYRKMGFRSEPKFKKGDKVWVGRNYKATILEVQPDGKYLVKSDIGGQTDIVGEQHLARA